MFLNQILHSSFEKKGPIFVLVLVKIISPCTTEEYESNAFLETKSFKKDLIETENFQWKDFLETD